MKKNISDFLNSMSRKEAFAWIARNTEHAWTDTTVKFRGEGFIVHYHRTLKMFIVS